MKLMETTAAVDRKGRLRIPAAILAELALAPGGEIRVLLSDNPDSLQAAWRAIVSGDGFKGNPDSDDETDGLSLSAEMLEDAGFHPGELLEIVCGERKIQITPREAESVPADPLDRMPKELRELFDDLGVDPDTVREVMEKGAYQEECAPTLKASESGSMMPSVLCLSDQGGARMDVSADVAATLRSQEHGHSPLVVGNRSEEHEDKSRSGESYCISGNIIDRQDQNGGNGIGVQADLSYTVTATDRHCVFSQQRSDEYAPNGVVSTQSARQYKDSTDLVCDDGQAGEKLIRRLTPLECERLQGFPDHWTDIPGASDSARYKALGNSVAIPCVEYVLRGITYFLHKWKEE